MANDHGKLLESNNNSRKHLSFNGYRQSVVAEKTNIRPITSLRASSLHCERAPLYNVGDEFDVTPLELRLTSIDELDQKPIPLFVEKLGSQIRALLLCRSVVNGHVLLLDRLAGLEKTQSHLFSTRAVGLVSFYMRYI